MRRRVVAVGLALVGAVAVASIWLAVQRPATSPAASTAAPEEPVTNCVHAPSACGFPDSTNTGVRDVAALRRVPQDLTSEPGWEWDPRGWIAVTGDGAVVENVVVEGSVEVFGADVTVRNCRILAAGETWGVGLRHSVNATITDNEIGVLGGSPRLLVGVKDIYGDATGTQVLRNEIVNASTGVQTSEGLIEGNFIHAMGHVDSDHVNGTTSNGSTRPLTIRRNTILNQLDQTDAISLFQDFGPEANRTITQNLIAGGGYTLYGGSGDYGTTSNIKITDNRFSDIFFADGGAFGPYTAFDAHGPGNEWSGNIWDHNGEPVE